ncbi:MAG: hypothetical protein ACHQ1H_08490 [Nitrososphaerales archaeon]
MAKLRPAWYSLEGSSTLHDVINLTHFPYTVWHLSYVLIGISLSPVIHTDRSTAVLIAYFLGLGIGAHALDETMGNPLQTKLSKSRLYLIGFSSLAAAASIGVYYAFTVSLLILPFVAVEAFFALTYNLETFVKRFHNMLVFTLSWGAIPFITGYFVNSLSLTPATLIVSASIAFLTYVQRTLSIQARSVRRNIPESVRSLQLSVDEVQISDRDLLSPAEKSLKALTAMIVFLAIGLFLQRL